MIFTVFAQAMTALGRAQTAFWYSFVAVMLTLMFGFAAAQFSVAFVALAYALTGFLLVPSVIARMALACNASRRAITYAYVGPLLAAIGMMVGVSWIGMALDKRLGDLQLLILLIGIGAALFILLSLLFARSHFLSAWGLFAKLTPFGSEKRRPK